MEGLQKGHHDQNDWEDDAHVRKCDVIHFDKKNGNLNGEQIVNVNVRGISSFIVFPHCYLKERASVQVEALCAITVLNHRVSCYLTTFLLIVG